MNQETVNKIISETEQGYDLISDKFSATRKFMWRDLEFIREKIEAQGKLLDLGCGNGRLIETLKDKNVKYYGVDVSQKLIEIARQKYPQFSQNFIKITGQDSLPFSDNFFNTAVSIAVFHHFPSHEYRLKMAQEIYRILKPEGILIVSVWNLWQWKYFSCVLANWWQKIKGKSDLAWTDCRISFQNNQGMKFNRYHHAFFVRELMGIFITQGFQIMEIKKRKNIILVARKK